MNTMEISGWATIRPFLTPIAGLLDDGDITNINVNADGTVFYEKAGRTYPAEGINFPESLKKIAAQNIARMAGQNISEGNPSLTTRLPDGSRIAAASDRISLGGHTLTIRRFPKRPYSLDELESFKMFPAEVGSLLREAVASHLNILVAGSTNSGKTTLINALCGEIQDSERIITLEDIAELRVMKPNVVTFQALEGTELTRVTLRTLLAETLRHNPDRIIVGEMRGGEAFDFLQTMNTGHDGCMSTIHASSARKALNRLASLTLLAGTGDTLNSAKDSIADALNLVVFQQKDKDRGKRHITEIVRLDGYDRISESFQTTTLYELPHSRYTPEPLGQIATGHSFTSTSLVETAA
jgi:pilus assembly protein CpaF